jgi:hypothetical protein
MNQINELMNEIETLSMPNTTDIVLYEKALAVKVVDDISKITAANMRMSIKDARDVIIKNLKPHKQSAHDRWKRICSIENDLVAPLDQADTHLKTQMRDYDTEQIRLRKAEELKARLLAEEKAKKEQEKILAMAAKAEIAGNNGKAETLLEKAAEVYAEPIAIPLPDRTIQTASGSVTTKVDIEVHLPTCVADIKLLCAAIANGLVPTSVIDISKAKLKQWAKLNNIIGYAHGVVFSEVGTTSLRRKI